MWEIRANPQPNQDEGVRRELPPLKRTWSVSEARKRRKRTRSM